MSAPAIEEMMHKLRLGALAQEWREVTYHDSEQYLRDLLQVELRGRERTRVSKLMKEASFPVPKDPEDFSWHSGISLPAGITKEGLESLEFIDRKENLIFLGNVGTGKTHLATALAMKAVREGRSVRFFTAAGLANTLPEKHSHDELGVFMKNLARAQLIVLDEIGFIPLHKDAAELLFQVVAQCYERASIVVTSNLELSRWNTVLGETQLTTATIDRLVHHSHIVIFQGESYRLSQSYARQQASTGCGAERTECVS